MKTSKNEEMEFRNEITHGNDTSSQENGQDSSPESNPDPVANRNYGTFDFDIDQEFIQENKKNKLNLVRPRHNHKQKFAPFTRSQRRKRRMEVYKLHFENGVPATRIAELMKVDRNTINNDLKILYREALNDYNPNDISLDDIIQKQLVRLETQRDRLSLYLCDSKNVSSKIAIERLIAEIDFKLIGAIEKLNHNDERFWDEVIKRLNKIAEDKKMGVRYTSLFELHEISTDSRKSLNKLRKEVWK